MDTNRVTVEQLEATVGQLATEIGDLPPNAVADLVRYLVDVALVKTFGVFYGRPNPYRMV